MPSHETARFEGEVVDLFAHRFTVKGARETILADLTPHGAEKVNLQRGDRVTLVGEQKPSELKVASIAKNGDAAVEIGHGPKHETADPAVALQAAKANGFTPLGEPTAKPKHFELRCRNAVGQTVELHIEHDGGIRKIKPVESEPQAKAS